MVQAVEKVRERVLRATSALDQASIPYAVAGGHAVASWVAQVDEGAVRNTRDADILIRRADFPAASAALAGAGFVPTEVLGVDVFLDGPHGKPSEGVHILYAGEKVRPEYSLASPEINESVATPAFRVVTLEGLVRMKLLAFRDKDRTHLRDLIGVGLLSSDWCQRLPQELAARLQQLLDNPEG